MINKNLRASETAEARMSIDECEVNTVYGMWMDKLKAKKLKTFGSIKAVVNKWPVKKAASSQKL